MKIIGKSLAKNGAPTKNRELSFISPSPLMSTGSPFSIKRSLEFIGSLIIENVSPYSYNIKNS